ncbi:MAG: hypothetical protein H6860_02785 [Rhodospirillales bacterium]|nr:hypothetical protein [Rhodospirillales bacterium]
MEFLVLILAVICVPAGLYLLFGFLSMRAGGHIDEFEITGFQKATDKGRALPVVRYEDGEGTLKLVEVRKIEQISYLFSPPIERQVIKVVGIESDMPRVYGYVRFLGGLILLLPGLAALGLHLHKTLFTGQVVYIVIFIGLMLGGWALLKFIQRH